MRLPVIFQNRIDKEKESGDFAPINCRGFLIMEALVALALMTILIPTALLLSWSNQKLGFSAQLQLISLASTTDFIENGAIYQIASSTQQYQHEFGRNTCSLMPHDESKGFVTADMYISTSSLNFPVNSIGTSLAVHNGFVYETTESSSKSLSDFFIIDDRNVSDPTVLSSLALSRGLAAITVSGYYAYVASESSLSQLKVIDIHDRFRPVVISQLKLPLSIPSTTAPFASSLFYDDGYIYLGTQKWTGNEMNIIDVSNPSAPSYINGFDTDSLVNSMYENSGYVYVATPSTNLQMDILDVHNPYSIIDLSHFSPAGSAVLEGKSFFYDSGSTFETANSTGTLYFTRSGGGFNNPNQYELFSFNLDRDRYAQNPTYFRDIPGGVYGSVYSQGYVFLATGDTAAGFQIWKSDFSKEIYSATFPAKFVSLICDHDRLYATLSSPPGFAVFIPH